MTGCFPITLGSALNSFFLEKGMTIALIGLSICVVLLLWFLHYYRLAARQSRDALLNILQTMEYVEVNGLPWYDTAVSNTKRSAYNMCESLWNAYHSARFADLDLDSSTLSMLAVDAREHARQHADKTVIEELQVRAQELADRLPESPLSANALYAAKRLRHDLDQLGGSHSAYPGPAVTARWIIEDIAAVLEAAAVGKPRPLRVMHTFVPSLKPLAYPSRSSPELSK